MWDFSSTAHKLKSLYRAIWITMNCSRAVFDYYLSLEGSGILVTRSGRGQCPWSRQLTIAICHRNRDWVWKAVAYVRNNGSLICERRDCVTLLVGCFSILIQENYFYLDCFFSLLKNVLQFKTTICIYNFLM